jgi:tetratricopeptide (TPR) repeat protein
MMNAHLACRIGLALALAAMGTPRVASAADARPAAAARALGDSVTPAEVIAGYLSGLLHEQRGEDEEALAEYRRALATDPGRASILLRIAEVSARLGDPGPALEAADQALQRQPGDPRALWLKGSALFNLGRRSEALGALRSAVEADSTVSEYWRTLAHVAEAQERLDLVDESWRHVVELDDADGEAWFQLAAAEARLGHFADADSMLTEALDLNPARPGAQFLQGWIQEGLGHTEAAILLYQEHLGVHPDDQATRRRLVGLLAQTDRLAEALREAETVRRARPHDPEAAGFTADLALRLGRDQRARELLDGIVADAPDDPTRAALVSAVLAQRGRGREAVERAEDWARRHPADYRGSMVLVQARVQTGDTLGAIAAARAAAAMVPDSIGPRYAAAGLLQSVGRYAAAESVWAGLARNEATAERAGLALADCREHLGDVEGAIAAARDVLERAPASARALNFLGYLYADHDRKLAEAEGLIRRALEQDPDNGAYVDSMGWVYYRQGRLEEARRELERAVHLTEGDPVVREHLGDVYVGLGLPDQARDQYQRSLAGDGSNARVRAKLSQLH